MASVTVQIGAHFVPLCTWDGGGQREGGNTASEGPHQQAAAGEQTSLSIVDTAV